jgi:uncharacterized protein YbjT (DUF2867 family)
MRGAKVRALIKRQQQTHDVRRAGASESVAGDMRDVETWGRALADVDAVYLIAPNMHPEETRIGRVALDEATRHGVGHLVYHSVLHPQTEGMPHHWQKLRVEEMILESGLPFTILQPAPYMQNLLGSWASIVGTGVFRVPYPVGTPLALVDLADVAQVAALVLTQPDHHGATYELVGTEPLAQTAVAATLSEVLGKQVRAEEWPLNAWRQNAKENGMPPYALETLQLMFRYYATYGFAGNANVLAWILGRRPRPLSEFALRVLED